jgi:hypothetical protein
MYVVCVDIGGSETEPNSRPRSHGAVDCQDGQKIGAAKLGLSSDETLLQLEHHL